MGLTGPEIARLVDEDAQLGHRGWQRGGVRLGQYRVRDDKGAYRSGGQVFDGGIGNVPTKTAGRGLQCLGLK